MLSTQAYAERLTQAYLGLDAWYRAAHPQDPWGLVVLNLSHLPVMELQDVHHAAQVFAELRQQAQHLPEADRRAYYTALCTSALTAMRWKADKLDLPQQIAGFLDAAPQAATPETLEDLRQQMQLCLRELGYKGSLEQAALQWQSDHQIPPQQIAPAMQALMQEARERTEALFGALQQPLPIVRIVSGAQFNARCNYASHTIEINQDPILTLPLLKHLTVHEVFPGHCLQFEWRQRAYNEGWGFADGLLSLVKSAGSPMFEGLADAGAWILDWEEPSDRLVALLSRYRAGLGTVAAWGLHQQSWSLEQATRYLSERSLMGGEGWVANRLAYIAPAGRGAHVWSYWLGEQRLRAVCKPKPALSTLRFLFGRMHSLASLGMAA